MPEAKAKTLAEFKAELQAELRQELQELKALEGRLQKVEALERRLQKLEAGYGELRASFQTDNYRLDELVKVWNKHVS